MSGNETGIGDYPAFLLVGMLGLPMTGLGLIGNLARLEKQFPLFSEKLLFEHFLNWHPQFLSKN